MSDSTTTPKFKIKRYIYDCEKTGTTLYTRVRIYWLIPRKTLKETFPKKDFSDYLFDSKDRLIAGYVSAYAAYPETVSLKETARELQWNQAMWDFFAFAPKLPDNEETLNAYLGDKTPVYLYLLHTYIPDIMRDVLSLEHIVQYAEDFVNELACGTVIYRGASATPESPFAYQKRAPFKKKKGIKLGYIDPTNEHNTENYNRETEFYECIKDPVCYVEFPTPEGEP